MIPEEWSSVDSTNLDAIRYDTQQEDLYVRFKNGKTYKYEQVPSEEAEALYHASSPGQYLRDNIIGTYNAQRM